MFSRAAVQVINGSHIKSALNSAQVQTYWYLNHLCPGNDAGGMVRLSQTLVTLMPKSPATPGVLFSVARGEMVALSHSSGQNILGYDSSMPSHFGQCAVVSLSLVNVVLESKVFCCFGRVVFCFSGAAGIEP